MQTILLTQVGGILKPFAWILGEILNYIYKFVELFGIENIALCIFLFTFVVKMLMLPLTIKQQKFTKLSSKMNPELTKIQEKYKGRKDEDSMRRQQAETQAVYRKYGASPMSGCLPLLISLPILFALYRVIYAIPAYVEDIRSLYCTIADGIIGLGVTNYGDSAASIVEGAEVITSSGKGISAITQFLTDNAIAVENNIVSTRIGTDVHLNSLIDILAKFNPSNWDAFFQLDAFKSLQPGLQSAVDQIISANNMFGLSILDAPKWNSISVIIPILAFATQFLQGKIQGSSQPQNNNGAASSTSKTMMTIMPIMSGVFCLMLPIGVGIYWIASAVFTILQTIFINKYLDKTNIDEMIEKNKEKAAKQQAKLGVTYDNKMGEVAKSQSRNTSVSRSGDFDNTSYKKNKNNTKKSGSDYRRSEVSYSSKSIAANANLLAGNSAKREAKAEKPAAVENAEKDSIEQVELLKPVELDVSENAPVIDNEPNNNDQSSKD